MNAETLFRTSVAGLFVFRVLSLLGCRSTQPGSTSHASVQVQGRSVEVIQQTATAVFREKGYGLAAASPEEMVFARPGSRRDALKWGGLLGQGVTMRVKVRLSQRLDGRSRGFKGVFSELEPPQDGVLRLAFAPGHYRLRVTFLNRVIAQPAELQVEVQEGRITPVSVTLTAAGTTLVEAKVFSRGGTAKGRYGRRTKIDSDETAMFGIAAAANLPIAYQLKERMPYAR